MQEADTGSRATEAAHDVLQGCRVLPSSSTAVEGGSFSLRATSLDFHSPGAQWYATLRSHDVTACGQLAWPEEHGRMVIQSARI